MIIATSVASFLVLFIAIRQLHPAGILFYQGLSLGLAIAALQLVVARRAFATAWETAAKDCAVTFLLVYGFVFTIPTTVDRSYSVRMIQKLDQSNEGMSKSDVENWFGEQFTRGSAVAKRLDEQQASGTIEESGGRFRLTPWGRVLAASFRFAQGLFACRDPGW